VIDRSLISVASWVAGSSRKGVEGTVILGKGGEGPVISCKDVLIGHLGVPVSSFAGRWKIVLHFGEGVVKVLVLFIEHLHHCQQFIILVVKLFEGGFHIILKVVE